MGTGYQIDHFIAMAIVVESLMQQHYACQVDETSSQSQKKWNYQPSQGRVSAEAQT